MARFKGISSIIDQYHAGMDIFDGKLYKVDENLIMSVRRGDFFLIFGNTYPIRKDLQELGASWDSARRLYKLPRDKGIMSLKNCVRLSVNRGWSYWLQIINDCCYGNTEVIDRLMATFTWRIFFDALLWGDVDGSRIIKGQDVFKWERRLHGFLSFDRMLKGKTSIPFLTEAIKEVTGIPHSEWGTHDNSGFIE